MFMCFVDHFNQPSSFFGLIAVRFPNRPRGTKPTGLLCTAQIQRIGYERSTQSPDQLVEQLHSLVRLARSCLRNSTFSGKIPQQVGHLLQVFIYFFAHVICLFIVLFSSSITSLGSCTF